MAAKKIKIDNASSKFKKQSKKREQKVIPMKLLLWELKMALRWHGVMKLLNYGICITFRM